MIVATVILLFVLVCVNFVWSKRKQYALSLKMPSPKGLPIIGILPKIYNMRNVLYVLEDFISECKSKTLFIWLGPIANVYTVDPEIVSIILNNSDCINKSAIYDGITDMIGDGVLTSRAPKWNAHRKLLNPFFSPKVLLGFLPVFNRLGKELCEKLDAQVGCGDVDLSKLLLNLGIKSSLETTMDIVLDPYKSELFLEQFERVCDVIMQRILRPWLRISIILRLSSLYKPMKEVQTGTISFLRKLIEGKVNESNLQQAHNKSTLLESTDIKESSNNNVYTFIHKTIQIHQNNNFTVDEVFENTILMVLGASETTAFTMFSTLLFLSMHPQYQEKVFEEICSVFPDKDFEANSEDLKNLVYLEMCINETMRLAPAIPVIGREASNDVTISQGIVIPKDTHIFVDIFNIHRSEDIWGTDAKSFNPDHFLPINLEGKPKYSYIPFSKGQRNCIGWRYGEIAMKTVLVHILRRYRLTTTFKYEDVRFVNNVVLRHDKVAYMEVHRRP